MAKLVKKKKRSRITGADTVVTFMEYLVTILCAAIMILVPLYMKQAYYEIGQCKYDIYKGITIFALPLLIVLAIVYLLLKREKNSILEFVKSLSWVDVAVLCYGMCTLISFMFCEYKENAWVGYVGWNMGLYAQLSFVVLYFLISRLAKDYKALLAILLSTSAIVILLGIMNRFVIDPLGVYEGIHDFYRVQFLSTLGQTSWYSSFLCVVLPIGIYAFVKSEKRSSLIITSCYVVLGFMSLVTQNSDSAYFALAGMLVVFFCFLLDGWKEIKRFIWIVLLFGLSAKIVWAISLVADNSVIIQLDKLSLSLINGIFPWLLMIFCGFLLGGIAMLEKKMAYPEKQMKILRTIFLCILGIVILVAVIFLVLSTKMGESVPWASISYLVWNEHWGNARGFTWEFSWKMFAELDWLDKLLGVGPECYPYYAYENYKEIVDQKWAGSVLTNAHNEWLNAIINYGVIGGLSYLSIFVTSIVTGIKQAKKCPVMILVIACVVSYMCHNFFCYQQVLCTPFIMIIIGIGQYISKKKD